MRTITAIAAVLFTGLSASGHAQQPGAKSLSQIELNAWSAYCTSQLDGNPSLCACILEKQMEQNDPNATASDSTAADDKLETMYSGDPGGAADARQAFNETLDGNINACTPKGD